jgi:3-phytase
MPLMLRRITAAALLAWLAACNDTSMSLDVAVLEESYLTGSDPAMNIDSVATHAGPDGVTWLFATAKEGDVIRIHDASSGEWLRNLGGAGEEPGQFQRPNGIVAIDGLLVVVERDNHRVQVFNLPQLESLAVVGGDDLIRPYGAYVHAIGDERYRLYVTDNYETADEQVPPESELDRRVHVFTLEVDRDAEGLARSVAATHVQTFGETSGPGVLRVVESLWGDPVHDRLMVAEEDPAGGRVLKTYTLAGRFTGEIVGADVFRVQPEGIALYECADGEGYWVTTDQDDGRNVFHVFERASLRHIGAFAGAATRNTDGIWLTREPLPGFPAGAFFAVHDDQAVAAFDWRLIAAALDLPAQCGGTSESQPSDRAYRALGFPDRIVLTPGADAAREMAVVYRTDARQTAAEAEIAPAIASAHKA